MAADPLGFDRFDLRHSGFAPDDEQVSGSGTDDPAPSSGESDDWSGDKPTLDGDLFASFATNEWFEKPESPEANLLSDGLSQLLSQATQHVAQAQNDSGSDTSDDHTAAEGDVDAFPGILPINLAFGTPAGSGNGAHGDGDLGHDRRDHVCPWRRGRIQLSPLAPRQHPIGAARAIDHRGSGPL